MRRHSFVFLAAGLMVTPVLGLPGVASAQVSVGISVGIAPPALPVYPQPDAPGPGYLWTPGYWADGPQGYYWVPGAWVLPPAAGLLWTPGWWGWSGAAYVWHAGYWAATVGYYGGINYGYGYPGTGYFGGYWRGNNFYYNRAVSNVNITLIHTTYEQPVARRAVSRVSYNGGEHGIAVRPTPEQAALSREHHVGETTLQTEHVRMAGAAPAQRFEENRGEPGIAATVHAGKFSGAGVVERQGTPGRYSYRNTGQSRGPGKPKTSGHPQKGKKKGNGNGLR